MDDVSIFLEARAGLFYERGVLFPMTFYLYPLLIAHATMEISGLHASILRNARPFWQAFSKPSELCLPRCCCIVSKALMSVRRVLSKFSLSSMWDMTRDHAVAGRGLRAARRQQDECGRFFQTETLTSFSSGIFLNKLTGPQICARAKIMLSMSKNCWNIWKQVLKTSTKLKTWSQR